MNEESLRLIIETSADIIKDTISNKDSYSHNNLYDLDLIISNAEDIVSTAKCLKRYIECQQDTDNK